MNILCNIFKDSLIYSRDPYCTIGLKYSRNSSDCNKGLIYSCGGCVTFKYFNFYLQLYERDYIQLVLSISYMYTLECIQGLWDICILRFLMKDKICYPSEITFSL